MRPLHLSVRPLHQPLLLPPPPLLQLTMLPLPLPLGLLHQPRNPQPPPLLQLLLLLLLVLPLPGGLLHLALHRREDAVVRQRQVCAQAYKGPRDLGQLLHLGLQAAPLGPRHVTRDLQHLGAHGVVGVGQRPQEVSQVARAKVRDEGKGVLFESPARTDSSSGSAGQGGGAWGFGQEVEGRGD